jgi:hypothetical protein
MFKTVKVLGLTEQPGTQTLSLPEGSQAVNVRRGENRRGMSFIHLTVVMPELKGDSKMTDIKYYLVAEDGLVPAASRFVGVVQGAFDVWFVFEQA